MLRLMLGKAGAGKTAAIINEIKQSVDLKQAGSLLIVPEQYSHEAERELCARCGDSLSLYAEVMSFTGLARRLRSLFGGGAAKYLDKGGRLLCMALALKNISSRLRLYTAAGRRAELQEALLKAVDVLKTACVSSEKLSEAAESCDGVLKDKLTDLALILESYEAVVNNVGADPMDALTVLAKQVEENGYGAGLKIYVDGFIDFTNQELQVLEALMAQGAELCVCMTVDDMEGDSEIFELSRRSCRKLIHIANEAGFEVRTEVMAQRSGDPALRFLNDNLFLYSDDKFDCSAPNIRLFEAKSIAEECEFAAAKALEFVRDKGLRWRDIAIAVRGFEDYRETLENCFELYGVPLYTARKSSLSQKPLPALISIAYDIIERGWDTEDVISYIRTGLTGLSVSDGDMLSDYIYKWQLKSAAWHREDDWQQHPDGYGAEETDESREKLARINSLRRQLATPLLNFQHNCRNASTAMEQAVALSQFIADLELPEKMEQRADALENAGRGELGQEYRQLWDICINAIEQCAAVLGDREADTAEFGRLFQLVLSKYDVGSIPVSLDRVSAGEFDRMRRRHIKELIVLGCSDDRLPQSDSGDGMFSGEELEKLLTLDIEIGGGSELWREFSLIYNCLSLPSEGLSMCMALNNDKGESLRPAFIYGRAAAIFSIEPEIVDIDDVRMSAPAPALELAANSFYSRSGKAAAAAQYFKDADNRSFALLSSASKMQRGRLSPLSVEELYGKSMKLTASRAEKFNSCKYAYFCQYGLRAKPYRPAEFKPPEIGTFMHYLLENTARDVKSMGGFKKVGNETLEQLCDKYVSMFISRELNDFREKSPRFRHLFHRICADARRIVLDMAEELRRSDFEPIDFELDILSAQGVKPMELGDDFSLSGVADRVDGWVHDGKLYLRVADYKTGKKKFSLGDVYYGMSLQMLLYLFTLTEGAQQRYGMELMPGGVMYIPASDEILSSDTCLSDEELEGERRKKLCRSGLVFNDEEVMEAWEHSDDKLYFPARGRNGKPDEDKLASAERMGILSRHIKELLGEMAEQLRGGAIAADPYYRSQSENACLYCDYFEACHFADGENGEALRYIPRLSDKKVWDILEGGGEDE